MNIIELHYQGGMLFMSVLSILFALIIASAIFGIIKDSQKWIKISQELGLFALVWGILGQVLGLFGAFQAIEIVGEVSQALLAGGLKVSSITTLYGLIIFLVAKLFKLAFIYKQK